jgi:hypothetical protein
VSLANRENFFVISPNRLIFRDAVISLRLRSSTASRAQSGSWPPVASSLENIFSSQSRFEKTQGFMGP